MLWKYLNQTKETNYSLSHRFPTEVHFKPEYLLLNSIVLFFLVLAHIFLFSWNLCKHGGKQVFKNWGLRILVTWFFKETRIFNFAALLNTIIHLKYVSRTKSILFLLLQAFACMWIYKHENVESWTTKKRPSKSRVFNLKNMNLWCGKPNAHISS